VETIAAVCRAPGEPLQIETVQLAPPGPREVLVEMVASGICHSDLHIINGSIPANLPIICGHEGAGIIRDVGPGVLGLRPGDHVVLAWAPTCGRCQYCVAGRSNLCETTIGPSYQGVLWDGTSRFADADGRPISHHLMVSSFSRYVVVPDGGAVRVPNDVPLARLAVLGCAVATGVGAVVNTGHVEVGATVAVIGAGGVGLNAVQGARLRGAGRVIAVDIRPDKLDTARRFGATDTVDASASDIVEALLEMTHGAGVDLAVEAVGRPDTVSAAVRSLRRGGTAVVVGLAGPGTVTEIDLYHLIDERRITGSYYGSTRPAVDIPRLVDLYRRGSLLIDELITEEITHQEINQAIERLEKGHVTRSLIRYQ
jgi:S-(hydroxymethyl)glutathione dehydrogenase / alcohol dehydrogenase